VERKLHGLKRDANCIREAEYKCDEWRSGRGIVAVSWKSVKDEDVLVKRV